MFPDYRSRIIEDYLKKREAKKLPLNLTNPSPARLRDECIIVCTERHHPKDERTLRAFFGEGADKKSCLQAINRLPIDRYKPLSNFLKKLQGGTEYKNIELLAWLIDYDNRPWDLGKNFDPRTAVQPPPQPDASPSVKPAAKPTRKRSITSWPWQRRY